MVGLILHQTLLVVIGQTETDRSVTSEGSSESIEDDVLKIPFEFSGDKLLEICLRDISLALMEHFNNQLFSSEELIDSQFSGSNGDGHN